MEPKPWLGQGCHLSTHRIPYPDLIDCEKHMTLGLTLPKICSQCQLCYFGGFPPEKMLLEKWLQAPDVKGIMLRLFFFYVMIELPGEKNNLKDRQVT